MKVTVYSVDGTHVTVKNLDDDTIQPMIEALSDDGVSVLAFNLDDAAMTYIIKANVVRVDVE